MTSSDLLQVVPTCERSKLLTTCSWLFQQLIMALQLDNVLFQQACYGFDKPKALLQLVASGQPCFKFVALLTTNVTSL